MMGTAAPCAPPPTPRSPGCAAAAAVGHSAGGGLLKWCTQHTRQDQIRCVQSDISCAAEKAAAAAVAAVSATTASHRFLQGRHKLETPTIKLPHDAQEESICLHQRQQMFQLQIDMLLPKRE